MSGYEVVVFDVDGYTYVQSFPTKIAAVMRERLNLDVADHERKVAERAWLEGHAAGIDYQGDGWNSDAHDPALDNPYRADATESEEA